MKVFAPTGDAANCLAIRAGSPPSRIATAVVFVLYCSVGTLLSLSFLGDNYAHAFALWFEFLLRVLVDLVCYFPK